MTVTTRTSNVTTTRLAVCSSSPRQQLSESACHGPCRRLTWSAHGRDTDRMPQVSGSVRRRVGCGSERGGGGGSMPLVPARCIERAGDVRCFLHRPITERNSDVQCLLHRPITERNSEIQCLLHRPIADRASHVQCLLHRPMTVYR